MTQINNDLFDDDVRRKLKSEISYVPDQINKKIDNALNEIDKRRISIRKVFSIGIASCIGVTLLFGMTMPSYISNMPIIGSIFKMFNNKAYENYDKYASDLNMTKESNGLKMTVNKVVYDEVQLSIFYTIESEEEIKDMPRFPGAELKINGEQTTFSAGGTGKFMNDNKTFVGSIEYDVAEHNLLPKEFENKHLKGGYIDIPDEFELTLNINEIGLSNPIKGNWDFNIPVSSEKVNGQVYEKECDIDLSNIVNGYHINTIITTPLNTVIQGTRTDEEDNDPNMLSFVVFDDKGRYIKNKSEGATGDKDENGNYIMYFTDTFKEVYEDTDSLTFIPYIYKLNYGNKDKGNVNEGEDNGDEDENNKAGDKNDITEKLNLKGETKLYSSDGREYLTITKIDTENGKTKIHYKSTYGISVESIEIIDNKSGENMLSFDNAYGGEDEKEATTYNKDSDEYVIDCDKEIAEGDYYVKTEDKSKSIEVYNDNKFIIKIKE